MVQSLVLLTTSINHSNMSINSSNGLSHSPTVAIEDYVNSFQEIPLTALSKKTLWKLSQSLNSSKILRSEEGYERDWRGLAFLARQNFFCHENAASGDDPTTKVIQLWCINNPKTATFAHLEQFLGIIDRWDVSDDLHENLVDDSKIYQSKIKLRLDLNSNENNDMNLKNFNADFGHGADPNIITTSDVIRVQKGLPPQMYDAFVLYAEADLNYASEMLTKLEDNPEYNFKLCIKDRDLLGGVQFEHVALTQLIDERCKHLIVILTEEFLKSPENKFLVNYTQAQQIQHKTRKIVPLLYEESVNVPRTLKIYTHLRYNPGTTSLFNFWSKLANSIQSVNRTADIEFQAPPSCHENCTYSTLTLNGPISNLPVCQINKMCNQPVEIPSISIMPPDENVHPKKKERAKLKPLIKLNPKNNNHVLLRSAHSIGQLNTSYQTKSMTSMSDLSTYSVYSEAKKKRKWSSKIIKKVFSRSSSKLQEA